MNIERLLAQFKQKIPIIGRKTKHHGPVTPEEFENIAMMELKNEPPPEDGRWFQEELNKIGGFVRAGMPYLKLWWGQDPSNTMRGLDHTVMKYPIVIDRVEQTIGYALKDTTTGKVTNYSLDKARRLFTDKDGELKAGKPGTILVPVVRKRDVMIGSPWWIIERWMPPTFFGPEHEWNEVERLACKEWNVDYYMGPWPRDGRYVWFMDIINITDKGDKDYKPLSPVVVEEVRATWEFQRKRAEQSYEQRVIKSVLSNKERKEKLFDEVFGDPAINKEAETITLGRHSVS